MSEPDWQPANPAERAMADALAAGDGPAYARELESAPLFVPALPAPGSPAAELVRGLLPDGVPCLPVFTSPEALAWVLGDLVGRYQQTRLAVLRQRWPGPRHQLAVNPGCPIATYLTMDDLADLAAGRESLMSIEELQRAVAARAYTDIRRDCLRELSGREPAPGATELAEHAPANPLETALSGAVSHQDGAAYLQALLEHEPVLLLTAGPVTDPEQVYDDDFPWRILDRDRARAVPVFSSQELLARTGAGDSTHVAIEFFDLLLAWPGEEHTLCVNLGSAMELILPGEAVLELVAEIAEALADQRQG